MRLPAQSLRKRILTERLLIMRLITSIGLALMLTIGISLMTHIEASESSGSTPFAMSALADPHVAAPDSAVAPHTSLEATVTGEALFGAALCILGVMCGLVFFALTRRLWARNDLPRLVVRANAPAVWFAPVAVTRPTALLLSQMGLSRT